MVDAWTLGVVLTAKDYLTGKLREAEGALRSLRGVSQTEIAAIKSQIESIKTWGTIGMAATEIGRRGVGFIREANQANTEIAAGVANLASVAVDSTGAMVIDMELARREALALAADFRGSGQDMLEIQYQLVSAGRDVTAVVGEEGRVVATVNQAIRGEAGETASMLATMSNNMTGSFEHIGDVVASTVKTHQIVGPQLAEALKFGVPAANQLGWSVESLAANIGALHDSGLKGSQSGTALSAFARQVLKAEKELGVEFERTADGGIELATVLDTLADKYTVNGERVGDYSELHDEAKLALQGAFGEEGMRAISFLWGQEEALRADAKALEATAGSADIMATAMGGFADVKWENIHDQWTQLKADLVEGNPLMEVFADTVTSVLKALNDAPEWLKNIIGVLVVGGSGIASVGGPLVALTQGLKLRGVLNQIKDLKAGEGGGATAAAPVTATDPARGIGGGLSVGGVVSGIMGAIGAVGAITMVIASVAMEIERAEINAIEARREVLQAEGDALRIEIEEKESAGEDASAEKAALAAIDRSEAVGAVNQSQSEIDLAIRKLTNVVRGEFIGGTRDHDEIAKLGEFQTYLQTHDTELRAGGTLGALEELDRLGLSNEKLMEQLGIISEARTAASASPLGGAWEAAKDIQTALSAAFEKPLGTTAEAAARAWATGDRESLVQHQDQLTRYNQAQSTGNLLEKAMLTAAENNIQIDLTGLNPLEEGFMEELVQRIQKAMNREEGATSSHWMSNLFK